MESQRGPLIELVHVLNFCINSFAISHQPASHANSHFLQAHLSAPLANQQYAPGVETKVMQVLRRCVSVIDQIGREGDRVNGYVVALSS